MFISLLTKRAISGTKNQKRRRKLLLHKKQIQKLEQETKGTGMTLVPLKVYIKDGYAKLLLGLAKGKHDYDKRESIKRREQNRDICARDESC